MKTSFVTIIFASSIALASPNATSAAGIDHGASGHAVVGTATKPFIGQGYRYGRPYYGSYGAPRFWFGYDPYWYGAGWGYYGYPYPYVVPNSGGLRLEIMPKTAQVFVDGYCAGVVDDFNGHFQHLNLAPGGHRIQVRQPGFQPLTFETYIQPGHTTDYKAALTPAPGA